MDWTLAIARNREALLRIIAALLVFAGVADGAGVSVLPRHVYRAVLRVLRPAESAVRRLIIIAARGLVLKPVQTRAAPVGLISKEGVRRNPVFPLIDPLKRFSPFAQEVPNAFELVDLDNTDDDEAGYDNGALPRISVPGLYDPVCVVQPVSSPDDPINAATLMRRLDALSRALADLPRQARRLARWQARRPLALAQHKHVRLTPFRPGRPPGFRLRAGLEVVNVLRECHLLALDSLAAPDSS